MTDRGRPRDREKERDRDRRRKIDDRDRGRRSRSPEKPKSSSRIIIIKMDSQSYHCESNQERRCPARLMWRKNGNVGVSSQPEPRIPSPPELFDFR